MNGASMLLITPPSSRTLPHQHPGKCHFCTNDKKPLNHSLLTSQEQTLAKPGLSSPAGPCISASRTTLGLRTSVVVPSKEKKERSTECQPHWNIHMLESAFDNRLRRDSHANCKTAAQLHCLLTFPDKSGITICTISYVALNICFMCCTEPHCVL